MTKDPLGGCSVHFIAKEQQSMVTGLQRGPPPQNHTPYYSAPYVVLFYTKSGLALLKQYDVVIV